MEFAHGQTVTRERRRPVPDPYNPDRQVPGSWEDELDVLELPAAWIAPSSSVSTRDATRTQILTSLSLFCTDPDADVRAGDRIRAGSADPMYVHVRPQAPMNPFTGWQPIVEVPLEEVEG